MIDRIEDNSRGRLRMIEDRTTTKHHSRNRLDQDWIRLDQDKIRLDLDEIRLDLDYIGLD